MTRDEAIEYGEEQLEIFGGQHHEFILMAIEALERKRGKWQKSDFGWRCSICGNTSVMWQRT